MISKYFHFVFCCWSFCLCMCLFCFVCCAGFTLRALHMLGECSTSELYTQSIFSETGSCYVDLADIKLEILLPQVTECWQIDICASMSDFSMISFKSSCQKTITLEAHVDFGKFQPSSPFQSTLGLGFPEVFLALWLSSSLEITMGNCASLDLQ